MYKIEKGITVPNTNRQKSIYPFGKMDVGDSFGVPREEREKLRRAATNYGKKNAAKFVVKTSDEEARVWRVG